MHASNKTFPVLLEASISLNYFPSAIDQETFLGQVGICCWPIWFPSRWDPFDQTIEYIFRNFDRASWKNASFRFHDIGAISGITIFNNISVRWRIYLPIFRPLKIPDILNKMKVCSDLSLLCSMTRVEKREKSGKYPGVDTERENTRHIPWY